MASISMKGRFARRATGVAAATFLLGGAVAAAATFRHAGPQGDGTAITPVGYRVTPAGTQTNLGDLPLALRLSPDGSVLLVSNDGQGTQSLQVVDPATSKVVQTLPSPSPKSLFVGLAFSPDGATAYASGGGDEQIHVYAVSGGHLSEGTPIGLPTTTPFGGKVNMFPAGLQATGDGKRLVVADHLADAASVVDLATKQVSTVAVGHAPYGVAVTPDGTTAFVSNQGANTVSVIDLTDATPSVPATVTVGTHPNAEALDAAGHRLYVADGDSDQISVVDTAASTVVKTIDLSPYDHATVGTNPIGMTLSADGGTLYVANSGNNDVDVIDTKQGRVEGCIPTAWYPSDVATNGSKLFVANARGLGAGPNDGPGYPNPASTAPTSPNEYVGSMMVGTLSTIGLPLRTAELARDTRQVAANDGFDNRQHFKDQPIQHVIYIVKENRTYDQEFGSLGKGNGDPSLNLFGDESATNSRALQRRFATLDNFYADAEVSAQGWNWSTASASNPYSEALWPADYSGRNAPYPSESGDPAIAPNKTPPSSYIWDQLGAAGLSFRNYGFYVNETPTHTFVAADPVLNANTDHNFRGFDLRCPENPETFTPLSPTCGTPRFTEWQNEFNQYVAGNNLPTVELVRLPNDHNAGTTPGAPTPAAYTADNDLSVGRLVDAVSHSKYWGSTAIFVTEDDAQDGPDHADAHRTISQIISPYTQTGRVDSTFYSTVSMLRTIEDIVGIRPLTQFDTFATPMSDSFTNKPDFTPYTAVKPADAGNIINAANAPMAAQSAAQPLDREDKIDMQVFNEAIWESVKGAASPMPAPRHGLNQAATTAQAEG
ncbi:MAG TPA: bifunctional YncE family protein/alkaline phosphatase family protein [Actinomycetota bacterium]|nr:bifunctional YncE family protein/alkaline phosphatase family protein [Actinomycetota bacterium]